MKKLKIFIDSSVIGGIYDEEFSDSSSKLFNSFLNNEFIPVISTLVLTEIQKAPDHIIIKLKELKNIEIKEITSEIEDLALKYIIVGTLTEKSIDDALHIATATVEKVDVMVSWNFKHIVNLNKIHIFNAINIKEGYNTLEIRTPREVLDES